MPIVKLNENNTLTIPTDLANKVGLATGVCLDLELDREGRLVLTPLATHPGPESIPSVQENINRKNLSTPIQAVRGVGPKLDEALAKKGIRSVEDLLYLLPHRYEDRSTIIPIARLAHGSIQVFHGEVLAAEAMTTKGGRRYFEVLLKDQSGTIALKWFNFNPMFMKRTWRTGRRGIFTGLVTQYGIQKEVHHPEVDWLGADEDVNAALTRDPVNYGRIVPVYPLTEGLSQKVMRKILRDVVCQFSESVTNHLPAQLCARHNLLKLHDALREVHFPESVTDLGCLNRGDFPAHRTLVFDEFFFLELGLALKKRGVALETGIPFSVTHRYTKPLLQLLPFQLTGAQRRVLSEIKADMMSPHPMHRLVQGDVGSGKTLVALMAALIAVENGCQVAIMAPTEILSEQHYLNIHSWCEKIGVTVVLLTSSLKGRSRTVALNAIADGTAQIVIGTQAVIQDKVEFKCLGLGIVDEQHRFGVIQRSVLKRKGANPDILVMTATPIPRTLSMTVFGDLSLSVIDELPPGRTPVETRVCFESRRPQVYATIRDEIRNGRQAYLICPLVEESEKTELKAATQMAEHLQKDIFPELRVGLLHGRMNPEEKESVMRSFKACDLDILVATTVIEVGIDVPNATVMVVEHAERFGLSQLHQLRGRVGRGSDRSRCLLIASGRQSEEGEKRLRVMESTTDGFRIAEADLEIRGPGDFLGTRQSGLPDFRVANILRDARLLEEARTEAFSVIETDPDLIRPEHAGLKTELLRRWGGRLELAGIA